MADETRIKWLYPPNFEGTFDAGTKNGHRRYTVLCTNYSDGTGEDHAIKVKRTDLLTVDGKVPSKLVVEKINYQISGMTVRISFNNINDEEIALLYESVGTVDFTPQGGFCPEDDVLTGEDDYAGDIIFTTANETLGDSYDITMTVRPKA